MKPVTVTILVLLILACLVIPVHAVVYSDEYNDLSARSNTVYDRVVKYSFGSFELLAQLQALELRRQTILMEKQNELLEEQNGLLRNIIVDKEPSNNSPVTHMVSSGHLCKYREIDPPEELARNWTIISCE